MRRSVYHRKFLSASSLYLIKGVERTAVPMAVPQPEEIVDFNPCDFSDESLSFAEAESSLRRDSKTNSRKSSFYYSGEEDDDDDDDRGIELNKTDGVEGFSEKDWLELNVLLEPKRRERKEAEDEGPRHTRPLSPYARRIPFGHPADISPIPSPNSQSDNHHVLNFGNSKYWPEESFRSWRDHQYTEDETSMTSERAFWEEFRTRSALGENLPDSKAGSNDAYDFSRMKKIINSFDSEILETSVRDFESFCEAVTFSGRSPAKTEEETGKKPANNKVDCDEQETTTQKLQCRVL